MSTGGRDKRQGGGATTLTITLPSAGIKVTAYLTTIFYIYRVWRRRVLKNGEQVPHAARSTCTATAICWVLETVASHLTAGDSFVVARNSMSSTEHGV